MSVLVLVNYFTLITKEKNKVTSFPQLSKKKSQSLSFNDPNKIHIHFALDWLGSINIPTIARIIYQAVIAMQY